MAYTPKIQRKVIYMPFTVFSIAVEYPVRPYFLTAFDHFALYKSGKQKF